MPSDLTWLITAGRMHRFLDRLARRNIQAVFAAGLSLEWQAPTGSDVTLALIEETGEVWTDVGAALLPWPEAEALAHAYVVELAVALDLCVNRSIANGVWILIDPSDRLPNLAQMLDRLDVWADALERLTDSLTTVAHGRR